MPDQADGSRAQGDRFYRGRIVKLFSGNQSGIIASETGRDLLFEYAYVRMVGSVDRFDDLREGMEVGFDVGRMSKGLRVTVIKAGEGESVGPEAEPERSEAPVQEPRPRGRSRGRGRRRRR